MIKIRKIEMPEKTYNCDGCGGYGNDIKSIIVYQTMKLNGKEEILGGSVSELRLCKTCRCEMRDALISTVD